ncbi:menaquinone-dependent protoporphyrinogen oxidase [Sinomonas atrocyanea]|uniref:flavodoxin domain-containing protein n=1 Tax=Sinomonas atrocyanea TaxID=37927 RepID=UPI0027812FA2|nr:flavodoxin domain-containing protein [Sinomonas atrocyanea]MDP9885020.1 menaquinone-dependent protoporphyrinogen oxidase [Sinomonas atrocyanea]
MNVLIAYASKHGATEEIAERIGSTLTAEGFAATVRAVADVDDVSHFDAVVLGSAAYASHWMHEANAFARRHHTSLAQRPVWLFASGPLGEEKVDKQGRDVREHSEPREFEKFADLLGVRGDHVFFGKWDPDSEPVGLMEKVMDHLPGHPREALPAGDFRDWDEVEAWAHGIAEELRAG